MVERSSDAIKNFQDILLKNLDKEEIPESEYVKMKAYIFRIFLVNHILEPLQKSPPEYNNLLVIWSELPKRVSSPKNKNWMHTLQIFDSTKIHNGYFKYPQNRLDFIDDIIRIRQDLPKNELDHNLFGNLKNDRGLLVCNVDEFYIRFLFTIFKYTKDPEKYFMKSNKE